MSLRTKLLILVVLFSLLVTLLGCMWWFRTRVTRELRTAARQVVLVEVEPLDCQVNGDWPWQPDAHGAFLGKVLNGGARSVVADIRFVAPNLVRKSAMGVLKETRSWDRVIFAGPAPPGGAPVATFADSGITFDDGGTAHVVGVDRSGSATALILAARASHVAEFTAESLNPDVLRLTWRDVVRASDQQVGAWMRDKIVIYAVRLEPFSPVIVAPWGQRVFRGELLASSLAKLLASQTKL